MNTFLKKLAIPLALIPGISSAGENVSAKLDAQNAYPTSIETLVSDVSSRTMSLVDSVAHFSQEKPQDSLAQALPLVKSIEDIPKLKEKAFEILEKKAEDYKKSVDSTEHKMINWGISMGKSVVNDDLTRLKEAISSKNEKDMTFYQESIAHFLENEFLDLLRK